MLVMQRSVTHLLIVIFLVVAPTAGALTYYWWTKNPSVRPLGITRESLDAFERGGGPVFEIIAQISYDPRHSGGRSQAELHRIFSNAFRAKGVHVNVKFARTGGAGTWVTYVVGPSTIGPYPLSEASNGINKAVEAYRMSVKPPAD
ncbi:hypothetical protein [Aliiroseovarius sp.]|uniref:hypothetical protein n=1 Tax=Aliiroseovarius sp. TaxID=1872442 RepID=UPI002630D921|nr:hypothetical protein [Aliiroseovarius sp.]